MTHSNEQWFSVDGQIIDANRVFNINPFSGSARYEKNYLCSYCKGTGKHRIRYAHTLGLCTSCNGTGKQGCLIKECFTLKELFKRNYAAAQQVVSSTSWLQKKLGNLSDIEKRIIYSSDKNLFLKSLSLTIQSGRPLSDKQIAVATRILSEIH